jgi:UDP:flavonoid glycosyltransferase YjiC (YdhE family)
MGGPVQALRRELNLAPAKYPVFDGQTSPYLTLATFSKALAQPQPDWPNNTVQTGYCFYEGTGKTLSPEVEEFLQPHFPPPIVFTLGSSCVWAAKDFFQIAARTALSVNRRALLLVGNDARNRANLPTHPDILTCAYAPHSLVFPRSSAIVHQGGVGTTGQALRSGRPSVIMPYAFDQLDNAMRCVERHCAVTLDKSKLADAPLAGALSKVLTNPDLIEGAKRAATVLATENGVATACDAIEERLLEK